MTIMLSFGRWGGFYLHRGFISRICFGFVALSFLRMDIDDLLQDLVDKIEGLDAIQP